MGLQRSGTNWINQLIKLNFCIETHDEPMAPFFKHAMPDETIWRAYANNAEVSTPVPEAYIGTHPDEIFILVVKEKQKWIESILRNPADLKQKRPVIFNNGAIDVLKASALYDFYHNRWSKLNYHNLLFVSYETVLSDVNSFLRGISILFGLERKRKKWENPSKVPRSKPFTESDKKRYLS